MTPLDNRDSTPADLRHPLVLAPALRRQPWPLLLLLAGCVGGSEHPIVTSETPTPDTPPDPPPETPQDPYIPPPYYPTADTSDTTAETSDTTNDGDRSHSPITEKQSRVNSHEFWKYPYLNAPLNSPLSTPILIRRSPGPLPPPPESPPDRAQYDIHENHPVHKAVFYLNNEPGRLPDGVGDNDIFRVGPNGGIFFRNAPNHEAPRDRDLTDRPDATGDAGYGAGDNIYHLYVPVTSDGGYRHVTIRVHDLVSERNWGDWNFRDRAYVVRRNAVEPDELPPSADDPTELAISHIMSGYVWRMPVRGPLVLTWSMATFLSPDAQENPHHLANQSQIEIFRAEINRAFGEYENAANLRFIEVDENQSGAGDIRFLFGVDDVPRVTGYVNHAYYPGQGTSYAVRISRLILDHVIGFNDAFFGVILHEIGHALGLSHPWDRGLDDPDHPNGTWPSLDTDRTEYLELSNPTRLYPQSVSTVASSGSFNLSPVDVAALQYMYGRPGTNDEGIIHRLKDPENPESRSETDSHSRPAAETPLPRGEAATGFSLSTNSVTFDLRGETEILSGRASFGERKLADIHIVDDGTGVNTPYHVFGGTRPDEINPAVHLVNEVSLNDNSLFMNLKWRLIKDQWSLWLVDDPEKNWTIHRRWNYHDPEVTQATYDVDLYLASSGGEFRAPADRLTAWMRIKFLIRDAAEPTAGTVATRQSDDAPRSFPPATIDDRPIQDSEMIEGPYVI